MKAQTAENYESTTHVETLTCSQCRKRWQVAWVEVGDGDAVEHSVTCDCGRVLKVVSVSEDDPPLMILQHNWSKTVAACLPAFIGGALFPVLSDTVLLIAYVISWIGCAATFADEDNRSISALGGIALWSITLITAAAAIGALAAHVLYWWWQ